jgi:hypothetical protein
VTIAESHLWDLLASGIPSMSYAAAANNVATIPGDKNFNMQTMRDVDTSGNPYWPQSRVSGFYGTRWLHSDIKNMATPYVYPIYEKMLKEGGFVQ